MSTEENKLPGRRFFEEILNNGNLAVDDELCAKAVTIVLVDVVLFLHAYVG